MMKMMMPRSCGSQLIASKAFTSHAPHVLDDVLDLVVGEQVAEAGHASGALTRRRPEALADLRAVLDGVDHVLFAVEVGVDGSAREVPPVGTDAADAGIAVAPALRVAPCTAVGAAVHVEVEQRLAEGRIHRGILASVDELLRIRLGGLLDLRLVGLRE